MRRAFEVPLAVRALFDAPTVAGIARHVEAAMWAQAKPAAAAGASARTELEI